MPRAINQVQTNAEHAALKTSRPSNHLRSSTPRSPSYHLCQLLHAVVVRLLPGRVPLAAPVPAGAAAGVAASPVMEG
jgi:hypothetical protein